MISRPTVQFVRATLAPFICGVLAGGWCATAAGVSLGTVIGPLAFAGLLVPPLAAGKDSRTDRSLVAAAVSLGLLVVPAGVLHSLAGPLVWWALIVISFALALAAVVHVLRSLRVAPGFASAVTIVVSLLWLSWPVWLSHYLDPLGGERLVGWLVAAHPLFATNTLFVKLGIWTEMGIAYRLTNLNQDVPYALPESPWPCVLLHLFVAAALLVPRRRPARTRGTLEDQPK